MLRRCYGSTPTTPSVPTLPALVLLVEPVLPILASPQLWNLSPPTPMSPSQTSNSVISVPPSLAREALLLQPPTRLQPQFRAHPHPPTLLAQPILPVLLKLNTDNGKSYQLTIPFKEFLFAHFFFTAVVRTGPGQLPAPLAQPAPSLTLTTASASESKFVA